jgi:opacity protein-like surface antigen
MRLSLLLPFSLLTVSASFAQSAQPDFVVTANGDTLRGRIRQVGKEFGPIRLYRPGQEPAVYGPSEARSFGSARGSEGESHTVGKQGKPQFVVPLVKGYVSLFTGENEKREKRYYLQVPDSAYVIEVALVTNQLTLARNLPGCPKLVFGSMELQRRYRYTNTGLSALVMAYNQCRQPQQPTTVVKRSSGLRLTGGLKVGLNLSDFQLLEKPFPATNTGSTGYQGGATLSLATRTSFSVQAEALYMTLRSTYGPYEASPGNSGIPSNTNLVSVRYNQFQFPVLVRYTLGFGNFRPFANAGVLYGMNTSNGSILTYPIAPSFKTVPLSIAKNYYGFAMGAGLAVHRAGLPGLTLEARYDNMEGTNNERGFIQKQTSLRFDLGISF